MIRNICLLWLSIWLALGGAVSAQSLAPSIGASEAAAPEAPEGPSAEELEAQLTSERELTAQREERGRAIRAAVDGLGSGAPLSSLTDLLG